MNEYLASILYTTVGCHLLLLISAELGGEHMQKLLRLLCGLVVLLTLFSPLTGLLSTLEEKLPAILAEAETALSVEEERTEASLSGAYGYIANTWVQLLADKCDIPPEKIAVTFHTDETGQVTSAEVLLTQCPYVKRRQAEKLLGEQMEIPVVVKGA